MHSVLYILTPPNIERLQEPRPQKDQNLQIPDYTGTNFANFMYTKLPTFQSRKKTAAPKIET